MAKVPETFLLPFDRAAIAAGDARQLLEYQRKLVFALQEMYAELANAINNNRDDYDAHTTHPP
jgi:hypothetical protein